MRILQLCPKPPLPSVDGGCLASYELSRLIQSTRSDLEVISLATEKHPFLRSEIDQDYISQTSFKAFEIKTAVNPIGVIKNLFERKSLHESRFYTKRFSEFLRQHFKNHKYDLIILDGLMTCPYLPDIRKYSGAKIVYRSHNVEHSLLEQRAENERGMIKKTYLKMQAGRLKKFELQTWEDVDRIWSISESDSEILKHSLKDVEKIKHLPFSMTAEEMKMDPKPNTLFHLGAMDWKPNSDGVLWFIEKVWPQVIDQIPGAELHLGGKGIDKMKDLLKGNGIQVHDMVENANDFYGSYEVMIVPIYSGSGLRIKIVQALSAGKAIVSTRAGVKGMPGTGGIHFEVSKDANEMASKIVDVLQNRDRIKSLEENARQLFNTTFERNVVSEILKKILPN